MKDRRALFFFAAALLCFALVPIADEKYWPIAIGTGVFYFVFALLSLLDPRSPGR
jgi:hypothetical protein